MQLLLYCRGRCSSSTSNNWWVTVFVCLVFNFNYSFNPSKTQMTTLVAEPSIYWFFFPPLCCILPMSSWLFCFKIIPFTISDILLLQVGFSIFLHYVTCLSFQKYAEQSWDNNCCIFSAMLIIYDRWYLGLGNRRKGWALQNIPYVKSVEFSMNKEIFLKLWVKIICVLSVWQKEQVTMGYSCLG